jgi:protein phosphatase
MTRKLNEDACLELSTRAIWAVADGMGGHAAGDYASHSIVEALATLPEPVSLSDAVSAIQQCLQGVNDRLTREARKRREKVIGSTAVVLQAFGPHAVIVWAGDSRAYRFRQDRLQQLTCDHSQVEELVAQGLITRQQAQRYPGSNVITRAVGVMDPLELDTEMIDIHEDDIFLLCSDGLYNEVSDSEIREALSAGDCQYSCRVLVERALARGARDNVTVVVVRALDEAQITKTRLNPQVKGDPRDDSDDGDPTQLK